MKDDEIVQQFVVGLDTIDVAHMESIRHLLAISEMFKTDQPIASITVSDKKLFWAALNALEQSLTVTQEEISSYWN